jgi:hypothetical protein
MSQPALKEQLRQLHLPGFVGAYAGQSQIAAQESWMCKAEKFVCT